MAGLSITRRRKAWLKGVAYGASGKGKCRYILPKLKDIFQRGTLHGQAHVDTPYVRAVVDQERRRHSPRPKTRGVGRFRPGASRGSSL